MEYPASYEKLKYIEKLFVRCFLNEKLVEPQLKKHTFGDTFSSYIFAKNVPLDDIVDISYYEKDNFGNILKIAEWKPHCLVDVKLKNAKAYLRVEDNAERMYQKCKGAINDIRMILYESEDKSKVLQLKDVIYNSAISGEDFKDRNENRKMAMKIFGLDQVKVDMDMDIYTAAGKNILRRLKDNGEGDISGGDNDTILPEVIEDIDMSSEE